MSGKTFTSYVVDTEAELPAHLKNRAPFALPNTEMLLRWDKNQAIGEQGAVQMAGAIEFQTQIDPGRLNDVCDPDEMYKPDLPLTFRFRCVYDPEIQRGTKDSNTGPKEFLRPSQIKSMRDDIMENRFECPQLMWNLRAAQTCWVYIREKNELRIYQGVATRPDTNHRHHAIIGIHREFLKWSSETESTKMGNYNPDRSYGLVIYTDDFQGEAHRFFVYNFKGWRVATSTARFIESKTAAPQLHTKLGRELMESSGILTSNVEILGNQLSRNSAKMITFGTLVEALRTSFPALTENEYDGTRIFLLQFLQELQRVRPNEISLLSVAQRQKVRLESLADQAVLWHAYFRAAARLRTAKPDAWPSTLDLLAKPLTGTAGNGQPTSVDPLSRSNPAWLTKGVIAPGKTGLRVVNNRPAKEAAYEYVLELLNLPKTQTAAA